MGFDVGRGDGGVDGGDGDNGDGGGGAGSRVEVDVGAMPASPPSEVAEAMAIAAMAYERLLSTGRALSFRTDQQGGLRIEVHDLKGNVLGSVAPSKALEIAGRGSLV